jgi:hypothetical protein
MSAENGSGSDGGLGKEGTIPDSDDGVAVGVSDGAGTTFEPEEDPSGAAGTDASGTGAASEEDKPRPDDTASGGPA